MIPVYNCANYLRQTLMSVLENAPGPDQMQIEVIDDASTADDPRAVVEEIAQGRVHYHRQPENVGAIRNFNTCIARSTGELVHILHGDDWVAPNFHQRMDELAREYPTAGLFTCRAFWVDEHSRIQRVGTTLPVTGELTRDSTPLAFANPLLTPTIVVRRSVYESVGGFRPDLVHTADWEMWARCINQQGAVATEEVLASYRVFAGSDTSRLRRTGENLRDYRRLASYLAELCPNFSTARFGSFLAEQARAQMIDFANRRDSDSVAANFAVWQELTTPAQRLRFRAQSAAIRLLQPILGACGLKVSRQPIDLS